MFGLLNVILRVEQLVSSIVNGSRTETWQPVNAILDKYLNQPGVLKARLDTSLFRPGKDAPQPVEAGRAPDRTAIMFCFPTPNLRAGQRLTVISGPELGTRWELKVIPDQIQGYSVAHHIECQISELTSMIRQEEFPDTEPEV